MIADVAGLTAPSALCTHRRKTRRRKRFRFRSFSRSRSTNIEKTMSHFDIFNRLEGRGRYVLKSVISEEVEWQINILRDSSLGDGCAVEATGT